MKELCRNLNIKQNISTTYHPQMDGQSERTNQWLEQYLRIFGNGVQTDWAKWLPLAQYTHNAWPSATTGKSPFELIMGHVPYVHMGKTHSLAPAIDSRLAQTKAMRQVVQQAITHAQQITVRATKYEPFEEGQKVWLEVTHQKTMHLMAKLGPKRYGPFEITATPRCHRRRTRVGSGANHGSKVLRTIQTTPIPGQVDRILRCAQHLGNCG